MLPNLPRCTALCATLLFSMLFAATACGQSSDASTELFAKTFDTHWERMRDDYPYFELYEVDWEAERRDHRPRAIAAADADEFAWEMGRMFAVLPDPHLTFIPSMETIKDRWSIPDVEVQMAGRHAFIIDWPEGEEPTPPPGFAQDAHAYPEITSIEGELPFGPAEILAAGPLGTSCKIRLRWPDGTETDHDLRRPDKPNIPPGNRHYGKRWLVTGRVGKIGYMRIKTFDPKRATLGPDGKMTTMLRAALKELDDTEGLIIDLQRNGGGLVAASDPFLGNLLERSLSYRWGNSGGKKRVIRPRTPRYSGKVVALVDERSASGGEWAARILRDAGRATVVGGRTLGAEAAVLTSKGPDGSMLHFSGWPMVEPGRKPFQEVGIEVDHSFPFTVESLRKYGHEEALARVRRARFGKALEVLGAPTEDLDALIALADAADRKELVADGESRPGHKKTVF